MKPKTLALVGNEKGGVTKTSSIGSIADALQTMGYTVRFLSGDKGSNLTLRKLYPGTIHYDVRDEDSMDAAIGDALEATEDIVFFDFPGFSSDLVKAYFESKDREDIANLGLRFVLIVVLTQHPEPVSGGISWVQSFMNYAEPMIIANGRDTPEGQPINIQSIPGADLLYKIAKNRVVEVPGFTGKKMPKTYNTFPAVPSSYHPGGAAFKALGMNLFSASPWKRHHAHVVRSLAPYAEWLVGKPIPKPFDAPSDTTEGVTDPEANADLERLKAMYSAEAQFGQADGADGADASGKNSSGKSKGRHE
jgi:hypothetical protein